MLDSSRTVWKVANLSTEKRAEYHSLAGSLGFSLFLTPLFTCSYQHDSEGSGKARVLVITKSSLDSESC